MTRTAAGIRHVAFGDLSAFEAVFLENGPDVRYLDGGLDDPSRLDPGRDEVAGILRRFDRRLRRSDLPVPSP